MYDAMNVFEGRKSQIKGIDDFDEWVLYLWLLL